MGKLKKMTPGRDLACLCKSKVTPLGSKSMSFQNIQELPKHTSQSTMPDPTACSDSENVYNTTTRSRAILVTKAWMMTSGSQTTRM